MNEILPRKTEKPWGYELLYALTDQYVGKVIFVKKGFRLGPGLPLERRGHHGSRGF